MHLGMIHGVTATVCHVHFCKVTHRMACSQCTLINPDSGVESSLIRLLVSLFMGLDTSQTVLADLENTQSMLGNGLFQGTRTFAILVQKFPTR